MKRYTLITGAGHGLGACFAQIAAREGRNLVLSSLPGDGLDELAQQLRTHGGEVVTIPMDLSRPGAARALWDRASDGRCVDVLVNNAGLGARGPFRDPAQGDRDAQTVAVNVAAAAELMRCALVKMAARGEGAVLNVASIAAYAPEPHMAIYGASKAFLLSLSEAVAAEQRGTGVTITALCPGPVDTRFFDAGNLSDAPFARTGRADPQQVAAIGWRAMLRGRPVVVPGLLNKLTVLGMRFGWRPFVLWTVGRRIR